MRALVSLLVLALLPATSETLGQSSTPASLEAVKKMKQLLAHQNATLGCVVNGIDGERLDVNVLIWPTTTGWKGVAFNLTRSAGAGVAPCWADLGQCAVIRGLLPDFSTYCDPKRNKLISHNPPIHAINNDIQPRLDALEGSEPYLELARGLQAGDTDVRFADTHQFFMSRQHDEVRGVRVVANGRSIHVARLRARVDEVKWPSLFNVASSLGITDFTLVGPKGYLTADGRLFLRTGCTRVVSPSVFRQRLSKADAIFTAEALPTTPDDWRRAYEDVLQRSLGSSPEFGPAVSYELTQEAALFYAAHPRTPCR